MAALPTPIALALGSQSQFKDGFSDRLWPGCRQADPVQNGDLEQPHREGGEAGDVYHPENIGILKTFSQVIPAPGQRPWSACGGALRRNRGSLEPLGGRDRGYQDPDLAGTEVPFRSLRSADGKNAIV